MTLPKVVKIMTMKKTEFQKIMEKSKPAFEGAPTTFNATKLASLFSEEAVMQGEMPSANCYGSARGMAELAAIMANKGQIFSNNFNDDGRSSALMSEVTWNKMHAGEKVALDGSLPGGMIL